MSQGQDGWGSESFLYVEHNTGLSGLLGTKLGSAFYKKPPQLMKINRSDHSTKATMVNLLTMAVFLRVGRLGRPPLSVVFFKKTATVNKMEIPCKIFCVAVSSIIKESSIPSAPNYNLFDFFSIKLSTRFIQILMRIYSNLS